MLGSYTASTLTASVGSAGFAPNVMMSPLRLWQQRWRRDPTCASEAQSDTFVKKSYVRERYGTAAEDGWRAMAGAFASDAFFQRMEAEIQTLTDSNASFSDADAQLLLRSRSMPSCYDGFSMSDEYFGPNGTDLPGFSFGYPSPCTSQVCASEKVAGLSRCFGPEGYFRDVWAASDYRGAIDGLLDNNWIDTDSHIVAARLQLGNAQLGCIGLFDVSFLQSVGGKWAPSFESGIACIADDGVDVPANVGTDLWSGEFIPLSYIPVYYWIVYAIAAAYLVLLIRRQLKFFFKVRRVVRLWFQQDDPSYLSSLGALISTPYVLDTAIFGLLIALLVLQVQYAYACDAIMSTQLGYRKAAVESAGLLAAVEAAYAQIKALDNSALRSSALWSLKASIGLGGIWEPSETLQNATAGFTYTSLAFDQEIPYVDFREITTSFKNTSAVSSFILVLGLIKSFRYLQVYAPLRTRYNTFSRCLPTIAYYILLIVHWQLAFVFLGQMIYGTKLYQFASLYEACAPLHAQPRFRRQLSPAETPPPSQDLTCAQLTRPPPPPRSARYLSLTSLLIGKALTAAMLINVAQDMTVGFMITSYLYVFLFVVVMSFTVSAMLISVFTESQADSSEMLRRQKERQKATVRPPYSPTPMCMRTPPSPWCHCLGATAPEQLPTVQSPVRRARRPPPRAPPSPPRAPPSTSRAPR